MEISQATIRARGQRLPRFTRVGADVLRFRIEERDLLAWRWIYDCRFLPTDYLHLLLSGSSQQITRRAQRWYHAGFVDRIRTGYADWILAIGNKGADEVCVRYDRDRGRINFDKKNQELKDAFFRAHTVSIARFRVLIELALRMKAMPEAAACLAQWPVHQQQAAMAEALAILQRQHHAAPWSPAVFEAKAKQVIVEHLTPGMVPQFRLKSLRDVSPIAPTIRLNDQGPDVPLWYMDDQGARRQIYPDWALTLMRRDDAFTCYLEVDRSTSSLESASGKRDMYLKLRAYWLYWQQTGHPFRMLMTCRSRERLEHMRALAREVVGKQAGSGLFWFALERDVDPYQPETFWQPLWQTAKSTEYHQVLV
jgi:Replication-relaxation